MIVHLDSMEAISRINDTSHIYDVNKNLTLYCRYLSSNNEHCKMEYVGKRTNRVADLLAKQCRTLHYIISPINVETILASPPGLIMDVLMEEKPPWVRNNSLKLSTPCFAS